MSYLGGAASGGEAAALEQQKLPAPEQAVIKSANECQICGQKFMVGQSFSVPSPFRKSVIGRMKHMCRVCTRVVCDLPGEQNGCCSTKMVQASLWARSLSALRKPDPKAECKVCDTTIATCSCGLGWCCSECDGNITALSTEYRPLRDELEQRLLKGDMSGLEHVLSHNSVKWLLERDCDDADDVRRMMAMQDRLVRAKNFFETSVQPKWERPPAKQRDFSRQVAKTALKAGGEVLNVAAWGKIKLGYKAVKYAATGYRLSEQITHYILSDEFMNAWNVLLSQLGEFAERDAKKKQREHKDTTASKAIQAVELCKRFYYFTQHLLLNRLSRQQQEEHHSLQKCTPEEVDGILEYMPIISMLYTTHRGGRKSLEEDKEAAWFLNHMVDDKMLLLDYVHKSGQDKRNRSRTRGAKHPAFALFVNEQDHHIVLAVRGTQDKNDHLTDLDLADCQLSDKDPCGVHRGMLNGARYILDEWGLLPFLKTAPSAYSIRLVGHSLGAGICSIIAALLMLEDDLKSRDIKVTGFGMPACVAPELADRMRPYVTSVVHREDAVPRLSFTNLVKLSEAFNQDQEREWCKKQLAVDVDGVWEYLGFSKKDPPPSEEVDTSESAAAGDAASDADNIQLPDSLAASTAPKIARDLVCAGTIYHLRQEIECGQYSAVRTDHTDPELCRIMVNGNCINDHHMDAYIKVLRGLNLQKRLAEVPDDKGKGRTLVNAVDEQGNFRPCSVCDRDVCDVYILKSDASRASATKHCMQCGLICCVECAPAGDQIPDYTQELGATKKLSDHRMVLPTLGTLELQRVCRRCQIKADPY